MTSGTGAVSTTCDTGTPSLGDSHEGSASAAATTRRSERADRRRAAASTASLKAAYSRSSTSRPGAAFSRPDVTAYAVRGVPGPAASDPVVASSSRPERPSGT